jgi:hydrogenase/urease accessory protein HupE
LWVPPAGGELRGQLTFDPELTRSLDAEPTDEVLTDAVKRDRITAFVAQQLHIEVNGKRCDTELSVRELYERGGATPGDLVMLTCRLARPSSLDIAVAVGPAFPALVVQGVGMTLGLPKLTAPSDEAGSSTPSPALTTVSGGGSVMFHRELPPAGSGPQRDSPNPPTALSPLAWAFFRRGLEHVLPTGVDHLLFVAAITLCNQRATRRLAGLLALFTFAHTLAVAWVAKGLWAPSTAVVEPCIAASIAVAGFAAYRRDTSWHVAPLIVLFGLIHGLGFAGGLVSLQPDWSSFLVSVIAFNAGVEVAQVAVVLAVAAVLYVASQRASETDRITSLCSLAIAAIGVVWTALRIIC